MGVDNAGVLRIAAKVEYVYRPNKFQPPDNMTIFLRGLLSS